MRILIATKNRGKFNEIAGFLSGDAGSGSLRRPSAALGAEVVFLGDFEVDDADFVEDGATHEENAGKKARYYWEKFCGGDDDGAAEAAAGDDGAAKAAVDFVLGEDSGIYVDALSDELGVQTRRWGAGEGASDEDWLTHFMKEMAKRAPGDEQRGAKFVCCACLVGGHDTSRGEPFEEFFKGETFGKITQEIADEVLPGLPLSSVFKPDGFDQVYAELGQDKKNEISHRGQAIAQVKSFSKNFLINLTNFLWNLKMF